MEKPILPKVERHWWYRLAKVVYAIVVFACFGVLYLVTPWPEPDYYESTYQVVCDNGFAFDSFDSDSIDITYPKFVHDKVFFTLKNSNDLWTAIAITSCNEQREIGADERIDLLHQYQQDTLPRSLTLPFGFSIEVKDQAYSPNYGEFHGFLLFTAGATAVLILVIPVLFQYILFGRRKKNPVA